MGRASKTLLWIVSWPGGHRIIRSSPGRFGQSKDNIETAGSARYARAAGHHRLHRGARPPHRRPAARTCGFRARSCCEPSIRRWTRSPARRSAKSGEWANGSRSGSTMICGWCCTLMIAGRLHWKDRRRQARRASRAGRVRFPERHAAAHRGRLQAPRVAARGARRSRAARARSGRPRSFAGDLAAVSRRALRARTTRSSAPSPIRAFFSGIGNAYSDEILHRRRLSPLALTQKLTPSRIAAACTPRRARRLREWIDRLRAEAGDGFPEKVTAFRPEMAVHGRFGNRARVCGAPVQRIRYADNETNYCPRCQTGGTHPRRPLAVAVAEGRLAAHPRRALVREIAGGDRHCSIETGTSVGCRPEGASCPVSLLCQLRRTTKSTDHADDPSVELCPVSRDGPRPGRILRQTRHR